MSTEPDEAPVRVLAVATAAAWFLMAAAVSWTFAPFEAMFKEVGVVLPRVTERVLSAAHAVQAVWGLAPVALLVAFVLLPLWIVPRDPAVRSWLWLSLVQAVIVGGCAAFAVVLLTAFTSVGSQCLCPAGCPHQVDGRLLTAVPVLVVAAAQLWPWRTISTAVLRQPPGDLGLEVARAVFVAGLPGALLATAVAVALAALDVPPPTGLVIALPLAGAATAFAAAVGVAVVLRVRSTTARDS